MKKKSILKKYGYVWVTLVLFLGSIIGHWIFAWFAFINEQTAHAQPVIFSDYLTEVLRDTLENWQSEFLQLIFVAVDQNVVGAILDSLHETSLKACIDHDLQIEVHSVRLSQVHVCLAFDFFALQLVLALQVRV